MYGGVTVDRVERLKKRLIALRDEINAHHGSEKVAFNQQDVKKGQHELLRLQRKNLDTARAGGVRRVAIRQVVGGAVDRAVQSAVQEGI